MSFTIIEPLANTNIKGNFIEYCNNNIIKQELKLANIIEQENEGIFIKGKSFPFTFYRKSISYYVCCDYVDLHNIIDKAFTKYVYPGSLLLSEYVSGRIDTINTKYGLNIYNQDFLNYFTRFVKHNENYFRILSI